MPAPAGLGSHQGTVVRGYGDAMSTPATPSGRNARRKAATRQAIVAAGDALFSMRGYTQTTMEDIAAAANVAPRTIYLHFESKPAILLAHFEGWLEAFVTAICERPVDEAIDATITAALARIEEQGWTDRPYGQMPTPHPTVEFIGEGDPQIAGRMMHAWAQAQQRIAADFVARGGAPAGSPAAFSRAAVVFASWTATILYARNGYAQGTLPAEASGNQVGREVAHQVAQALGATDAASPEPASPEPTP